MCCFFFQAEDGIRDWSVTGVQTCALPISEGAVIRAAAAGVKNHQRPQRVTVEIVWRVEEALVHLRDEGQLIEVLDGFALLVADDLSRSTAPDQTVHGGEIRPARLRGQPIAH